MSTALELLRCDRCGHATALPLPGCPACGAERLSAVVSSGIGTLYTWTTTHHIFDPDGGSDVPYTVGMVTLDEGARIPARIVSVEPDNLRAGLTLRLLPGEDRLTFAPREE